VAEHPEMQLTTINPALVLGEPMDGNYGTSLSVIERILGGKDPMMPDIGFGLVDVADISAMHVAALQNPQSIGQRFIGANGTMTMPRIAQHLAARHPDRKIATRIAPKFVLRILSLFDPSIRTVLPGIGDTPQFDNTRAREMLGIDFTAPIAAIEKLRTRCWQRLKWRMRAFLALPIPEDTVAALCAQGAHPFGRPCRRTTCT
jgi:dihydroflavonol-4-reductase